MLSKSKQIAVTAIAAAALCVGLSAPAQSQDKKVRITMQTAFNPNLSVIGEASKHFSDLVMAMSGGSIEIRFYEAGKLVPTFEMFDAVKGGTLDASYGWPGYIMGKIPAMTLFGAVPFGPTTEEYMAWVLEGNGNKMFAEIYARHGIHAMICGFIGPEAAGWFTKEINKPEDFKGMKIRYAGLGGEVLAKLGASITVVPAGEIFPNLEKGVIDASEFSMPSVDKGLGFYKVAKNYYFPGWHQPASTGEFFMKKDKWDALSPAQRAIFEGACKANMAWEIARGINEQAAALDFYKKEGVNIKRWPPEVMDALRKATAEVMADQAAKDADFKRVWEDMQAYVAKAREWQKLATP
jgi:TRAP-type mannitol/chloroaromatic compound transport system substrate-binding protein